MLEIVDSSIPQLFRANKHSFKWDGIIGSCTCPFIDDYSKSRFCFTSDHFICFSCGYSGTLQDFIYARIIRNKQFTARINGDRFRESCLTIRQLIMDEFDQKLSQSKEFNEEAQKKLIQRRTKERWSDREYQNRLTMVRYGHQVDVVGLIDDREAILDKPWLRS